MTSPQDVTFPVASRNAGAHPDRAGLHSAVSGVCELDAAPDVIFALVHRQMRSLVSPRRADFDDLVQVAAEQVLRALPTFEGRARLSTWTYRICYLTLLKSDRWYRRWSRRFTLTAEGNLPDSPATTPSPASQADQDERQRRLYLALARLSPKLRAAVVMHDLQGMHVDEIAVVVETKVNTVRSRVRDGRRELARILSKDAYFGHDACSLTLGGDKPDLRARTTRRVFPAMNAGAATEGERP